MRAGQRRDFMTAQPGVLASTEEICANVQCAYVCYAPRQLLSHRKWLGVVLPYEDHLLLMTRTLCRISV